MNRSIEEILDAIRKCNENITLDLETIQKDKLRLEECFDSIEDHAKLIRRYTRLVLDGIDKINY